MSTIDEIAAVGAALLGFSYRFQNEAELQAGIAQALDKAGIPYQRERILSPRDRIDFLLDRGLGIEVKIDGPVSALTRQVFRYAELPEVRALLVVVAKQGLNRLPPVVNGKPVEVLYVGRCFA